MYLECLYLFIPIKFFQLFNWNLSFWICVFYKLYLKKYSFKGGTIDIWLFNTWTGVTNKALVEIKRENCYEKQSEFILIKEDVYAVKNWSPFSPDLGNEKEMISISFEFG